MISSTHRTLAALCRRLDAKALEQLRAVAADQIATIERQQREIELLQARVRDAELFADHWRDDAIEAQALLQEEHGYQVGLTMCGQVLLTPAGGVRA